MLEMRIEGLYHSIYSASITDHEWCTDVPEAARILANPARGRSVILVFLCAPLFLITQHEQERLLQ